jgi:type IV pilus assembly protein PilO
MRTKMVEEIFKAQPRTFILIFVLILVNIGFFLFTAAYLTPHFERLQNQWFEKRKIMTGGAGLDEATIYQQGTRDLTVWRDKIISKREFTKFIGTLYETASNNSLTFSGLSYKVVQLKEKNLVAYSLDINVSGKYGAIKSFISDIGRMPEIITTDNISLNNKTFTEDHVDLRVQLTVYLKMEEQ